LLTFVYKPVMASIDTRGSVACGPEPRNNDDAHRSTSAEGLLRELFCAPSPHAKSPRLVPRHRPFRTPARSFHRRSPRISDSMNFPFGTYNVASATGFAEAASNINVAAGSVLEMTLLFAH
jgi:hypothetical protein